MLEEKSVNNVLHSMLFIYLFFQENNGFYKYDKFAMLVFSVQVLIRQNVSLL